MICLERDANLPIAHQEEAVLTLKVERKPPGLCHIPKDTYFPDHSRLVLMPGHLFKCNPEDEVTTQRGTDTPAVASSSRSRRFQVQLDSGLTPHEQLEMQVDFRASTQDES